VRRNRAGHTQGTWAWGERSVAVRGQCSRALRDQRSVFIVPDEREADVTVASPILGTFVFLVDDGNEVVDVLFVSVSDAKIVKDQGEHEVAVKMFPQAAGHRAWYLAKRGHIIC
jgi:hypothetical protein